MRRILLFRNIRQVMLAERVAKEKSIKTKIIPVPRQLSSECGMCIELFDSQEPALLELLRNNNIEFQHESI